MRPTSSETPLQSVRPAAPSSAAPLFLEGPRLYFRAAEPEDADRCTRWLNDPDTRRFLHTFRPYSEHFERRHIEGWTDKTDEIHFAIVLKENDRHIGMAGLHQIHPVARHATFGILIGEKDCRGRGLGTEATRMTVAYAFDTLNLHRVQLDVYAFNVAGIRSYEKTGFVREGLLREHHFADGRYHDVLRYGLLAREFAAKRGT
ncbi:MAG: GNAT family N-acetyltransferase [Phycisphaerae bacterium]|nr:GNAT family N-acetyltransferase [Phycisphaerae bacterium]